MQYRDNEFFIDELRNILNFDNTLPYLFIGSGFSRRYLGTPDWKGLLRHFSDILYPNDPLSFQVLQERAVQKIEFDKKDTNSTNVVNSYMANIIEQEFNINWYTNPLYEDSRKTSLSLLEQGATPFKIEIANYFKNALNTPYLLQDELDKLKSITSNSISGIITTNYDCLIEEFFDFTKYVSQEELLFSSNQELCEIYKIHGCVTKPDSIIINSKDYEMIAKKRKYLAAKLLTIFVEHPIVFIGYSITDEDIIAILTDIVDCLSPAQLDALQSRLIFVDYLPSDSSDECIIENTSMYINQKRIPMVKLLIKNYGILYEVLAQNKTKYPVKLLRSLKQNIYELIATNDPSDKLKIMLPIDQIDNYSNVEFVIGVGVAQIAELAYASYSAEDIYLDIIFDNKDFNADLLVENTLLPHLSRTSGSMPIYKYISRYSKSALPVEYGHYLEKTDSIEKLFSTTIKRERGTIAGSSISEICKYHSFPKSLYYISRLPVDLIDKNELGLYLSTLLRDDIDLIRTGKQHPHSSNIRRLIKVYDWLMYYDDYKIKQASMQSVPDGTCRG